MPEKNEKMTNEQSSFEKKFGEAKESMKETAGKVGEQSKKVVGKIEKRWKKSDNSEKVCMIVGIILLIIGICGLGLDVLLWVLCIVIGILFVTGFFNNPSKKE